MKRNTSAIPMLLFAVLIGFNVEGQEQDPFHITYSHLPLKDTENGHISQWDIGLMLPLHKSETLAMATGLNLNLLQLRHFPMDIGEQLYQVTLPLVGRVPLNTREHFFFAGRIAMSSDLKDISFEDVTFSLGMGFQRKISERWSLGLGLGYAHQFFGNQILPFVEFKYQPNGKAVFSGRFPLNMTYERFLSQRNKIGMGWKLGANSFRLSEDDYQDDFIRQNHFQAALFFTQNIYGGFHLKLSTGFVGQKYQRFQDSDGDGWTLVTFPLAKEPEPLEEFENRNAFFEIGLHYSF